MAKKKGYFMKNIILALFLTFAVGVWAGEGWVIRDPSQPVLEPKVRALASTGSNKLPDRLPIGDRETVLNYIVAPNNMGAYISISLWGMRPDRFEVGTGRFSPGYGSYREFLRDLRTGVEMIYETFLTNGFKPASNVWADLSIIYFSRGEYAEPTGNGLALLTQNDAGLFKDLTVDKVMEALDPSREINIIQVIVPVPRLESVQMSVEVQPGITAEMSWSEERGSILNSSWSSGIGKREWTTPTYLYLRYPVADGSHYGRITLTTKSGERATYTQFGYKVEEPTLGLSTSEIRVNSNPGSDVLIESTADFRSWKTEFIIKSAQAEMILPIQMKDGWRFYKATAK